MNRFRCFHCCVCLVLFAASLPTTSVAQGTLASNRDLMRRIAEGVANVIQKNFYDPSLKGIDWKKTLADTKEKINQCNSVGEMNAAIHRMVQKVDDSRTNFVPPSLTMEPRFGFDAKAYGETVLVYRVKKGGPAAKAGLLAGDAILAVDGVVADRKHYPLAQYYYRFIQPAGVMILDYVRDGSRNRVTIQAEVQTHAAITYAYEFYRAVDWAREEQTVESENRFAHASDDGVGYVKIAEFTSGGDLSRIEPSFPGVTAHFTGVEEVMGKVKGSRALVVDLRGNPGGAFDVLESFASKFDQDQTSFTFGLNPARGSPDVLERFVGYFDRDPTEIAEEIDRDTRHKIFSKPHHPSYSDIPIAVLVDSESANNSEVVARHLQRTGRAVIIGDKTAGHVSVARQFMQKIGADPAVFYGVQTTVAQVLFPDGKGLEITGVTPDIMCIPTAADLAAGKDPCLALAMNTLKAKLGKGAGTQN